MDLYGIDLNLLVAFDALMAERSVTKAGRRVGRTQPAMSAALARLRDLLDDELFVRGKDQLQPTARALELAEPIGRALRDLGQVLGSARDFDPAASDVTLNLALQEHAAFKVLPDLVGCLREQAPALRLNVISYRARDEAFSLLDNGEAELAIGMTPRSAPGRIFTRRLFEEPFVCVVRRNHPTLSGGGLDLETFLGLQHLLVSPEGDSFGHVDAELTKLGRKRSLKLVISQLYPAPALIAGSDMIATLMRGVVDASGWSDRLVMLPPPFPLEPCAYVMSWHRRNDAHPAQRWLRTCATSICLQNEQTLPPTRDQGPA